MQHRETILVTIDYKMNNPNVDEDFDPGRTDSSWWYILLPIGILLVASYVTDESPLLLLFIGFVMLIPSVLYRVIFYEHWRKRKIRNMRRSLRDRRINELVKAADEAGVLDSDYYTESVVRRLKNDHTNVV